MKIALASAKFINRDVAFNLAQIEKYMREAKTAGAELVCFGESFLQGFACLDCEFETDKHMAVSMSSPEILKLCKLTEEIEIDVLFGFIEREGDILYSSCAILGRGKLLHLYRRISEGWKEYWRTDNHYREGDAVELFMYHGRKCLIALCGDLWVYPERFCQGEDVLLWPLYINYSIEEWQNSAMMEYAEQAAKACSNVLMINSVADCEEPAHGGCYHFAEGEVKDACHLGEEGILVVEV